MQTFINALDIGPPRASTEAQARQISEQSMHNEMHFRIIVLPLVIAPIDACTQFSQAMTHCEHTWAQSVA